MKIGWIFPHRDRCGIAQYARDYADTLRPHAELVEIDPRWWPDNRQLFLEKLTGCDIVHVQYDTAAYMRGRRDYFGEMAYSVKVPLVVSLHEVYGEDPAVFARSRITGRFPLLQVRRAVWDLRHPVQRAFDRHCARSFFADTVLVHQQYHTGIIAQKGCIPNLVRVEPMPLKRSGTGGAIIFPDLPSIRLGAFGFVNPLFDYELLLAALEKLRRPWTFTWIGGIRTAAEGPLLDALKKRIAGETWSDRFIITGWVPEAELPARLENIDIVCAFFRERSSSASIARVIGAGKAVVAASIPLTREIASINVPTGAPPPVVLTEQTAGSVVESIERLCTDGNFRESLYGGLCAYRDSVSFENMADRLCTVYRELLAA